MEIIQDKRKWRVRPTLENLKCPFLYYPANIHACRHPDHPEQDPSDSPLCDADKCPIKVMTGGNNETGKIFEGEHLNKARAIRVARFLRSEGISIRKIMRLMDYKSPRSVQDLLETDSGTGTSVWPPEEKGYTDGKY